MRKILFILTALLYCGTGHAQFDAYLCNTRFSFFVNEDDMTCEIRDDEHRIDDRKYAFNNPRKINAFKKSGGTRTLVVPEKVTLNGKDYIVTAIGRAAFAGYSNIDYIILPNTVTRIGDYAFFYSSIKGIELPPNVSQVGKRAFGYCENLRNITTLMGGVHIAKEDFAESKNCEQTFKSMEEYAKANLMPSSLNFENEKKDGGKKKNVKSDVDSHLPVASYKNENLFAVIIANENYQSVAPVDYALHDGEVFKQYCQTVLGIPEPNISFLRNATLLNMRREVSQMKKIADAYDGQTRFIFYYAGHGFPDDTGKTSYLLPVDGVSTDKQQGYNLEELYQQLGALNTKRVVVFLDACFSGSLRGDGMLDAARGVVITQQPSKPKGSMVVFSAAQGDETANPYPDQGHGLFTYFLLKKLKESPNATLGELNDYINSEVRKYSNVRIRKSQTPSVNPSPQISDSWRSMTLK